MPEARDGDRAFYSKCELGDKCPDFKAGFEHAHLVRVERAEPEDSDGLPGGSPSTRAVDYSSDSDADSSGEADFEKRTDCNPHPTMGHATMRYRGLRAACHLPCPAEGQPVRP